MTLKQMQQTIRRKTLFRLRDNQKRRINRVDAFFGSPGIGKTTTARVVAHGMNMECQVWHPGNQGFEDITGLPIQKEQTVSGKKQTVMEFAKAAHVPGAAWQKYPKGVPGLLGVFDDLHRTKVESQGQIVEIIDSYLNGEPVDPKCVYICTGNPPTAAIVTGQVMDEALEDRLNVHIVVPTSEELLEIWSKFMPERIYKFLVMNPTAVTAISARTWDGIAIDVQNMIEAGATPAEIGLDIFSDMLDHENIRLNLVRFLQHGGDPYYFPVLGRELVRASDKQMDEYVALLGRWDKDDKRGLIGESKNDLLRTLNTLETSDYSEKSFRPTAGKNVAAFLEKLASIKCNDMVKDILTTIYNGELVHEVATLIKQSSMLGEMSKAYERFEAKRAELQGATPSQP